MSKKHDEAKDIAILRRKGVKVERDGMNKHLIIPKNTLGIRYLGKIDFLVNYCGYIPIYGNSLATSTTESKSFRDTKKQKKEHKLTDKTKGKKQKK